MQVPFYLNQIPAPAAVVIRDCLADAVQQARNRYPDLKALILYGSFCAGDFAMRQTGVTTWRFISDFDLVMVLPHLQVLRYRLAAPKTSWQLCHGAVADVALESGFSLRRSIRTMEYYNICHGGLLLWGRDDMLPGKDSAQPLSQGQGLRLLANRLWGILEALDGPEEMLNHRLTKGLLACLHSDCLLQGIYEPSAVRLLALYRAKKESDLPQGLPPELLDKINHALLGNLGKKPAVNAHQLTATLRLLLHYMALSFQKITATAVLWDHFLPRLVRMPWQGWPFTANMLSFLYRSVAQQRRIPPLSLHPLFAPVCLRIWAGWITLALAVLDKSPQRLELYNRLMAWFPGYTPATSIKTAILANPSWQRQVPVTSRI
ncbi:MAG: hypothetical protein ACOY32_02025 [Thermodesulfobacteriota bacterium]